MFWVSILQVFSHFLNIYISIDFDRIVSQLSYAKIKAWPSFYQPELKAVRNVRIKAANRDLTFPLLNLPT